LARTTEEVVDRLMDDADAAEIGRAARKRIIAAHTAAHRAEELEQAIREAAEAKPTQPMK
jgi:spore maturation protein CgeB